MSSKEIVDAVASHAPDSHRGGVAGEGARCGATGHRAGSPEPVAGGERVPSPGVDEYSTVTQDYLKAVWSACEWGGAGASVTGLAARMNVAPSTASENVARLVEAGLLEHEPYKAVTLTPAGRERAMRMVRRHRLLETYLVERLGFEWHEVHAEAEELEHACSPRLLAALDKALGYPVRDPHGDPIPSAQGDLVVPQLRSLDVVAVGRTVVVGRILDDPDTLRDLTGAGIGLDSPITVVDRERLEEGTKSRARATTIRLAVPRPGGASSGVLAAAPTLTVAPGTVWVLA